MIFFSVQDPLEYEKINLNNSSHKNKQNCTISKLKRLERKNILPLDGTSDGKACVCEGAFFFPLIGSFYEGELCM
jgi:hypothetical protein